MWEKEGNDFNTPSTEYGDEYCTGGWAVQKKRILLAEKQQRVQLQELLDKMEALNEQLMHLKEGSPTLENVSIDAFADPQMDNLLHQLHKAQDKCDKKE